MVRYLITGGAGFIGSILAHALVARKKTVRILDDFSTGQSVTLRGIEASVEILRGDLCDAEAVGCAVADVDVVLHEAALNSNPHSI